MIDEKKLIEKLEDEILRVNTESTPGCGNLYGRDASVMRNTLNFVIDLINEQPKVGEWIPVEERLPKHDGDYLIQAINDYEGIYMAVSNYDSQYKSFSSDGVEDDNAIAWMDLPKMYEVKE